MKYKTQVNCRREFSFITIILLHSFFGCVKNGKSLSTLQQTPHVALKATPPKWKEGEAVILEITSIAKDNHTEPNHPQIFIHPQLGKLTLLESGSTYQYRWLPDSLLYLSQDKHFIILAGLFRNEAKKMVFTTKEKVLIQRDSCGYYVFQNEPNSYSIDTLHLKD